ncbi:hydrolase [Marinicauda pacifica]|uniref:Alpha/beta hydrolase n=1 Tax=Marinicauda pacifica TaxID=1133559 RepID=A0A4S2HBZ3_9PROT|nr:alpha/beta hydrolase [Marinicauda pacifica]TGY93181.1 alpha/beta hydrolase [Marinicauda pacifica]GGE43544.1 hydrolase [Marinicauda pacifica]
MIEHIPARPGLSPRRWLARRMARKAGRTSLSPNQPAEVQRARMDKAGDALPTASGVEVSRIEYAGRPALRFVPEGARDGVLLFLHGGGYSRGSAQSHKPFVSNLSRALRLEAVSLDYRLAPEHPCPAAIDDALAAYRTLRSDTQGPILMAGDSAGGGLALATTLRLKADGDRLPDALYLLSPWVDLTMSGESARTKDGIDPMLKTSYLHKGAELYLHGADGQSPDASPLFADLSGLPPTYIQVGSDEILLDDSVRLAEKLAEAGVAVKCEIWEKLWHDFQLFAPLLPEAYKAIKRVPDWAAPYLSSQAD